jgi:phosphoribosyl 1,2-cyclic phosphodiesterase
MSDSSVVVDILASGSRGNCAVFSFGSTRLVVDAGISVRQFRAACAERNIPVDSITGMALTHEHKDHVAHLQPFRKTWSHWPVWASAGTIRGSVLRGESTFDWQHVRDGRSFRIGEVDVLPIRLSHDAYEPVGFLFEYRDFRVLHLTDTGVVTPAMQEHVRDVDLLLVEANYDPQMLRSGPYPEFLQRRVSGSHGHLDNQQGADLTRLASSARLRQVVLMHLSENNNAPELALQAVRPVVPDHIPVGCATQREGFPSLRYLVGPRMDRRGQALLF